VQMFINEAKIAVSLNHANIVQVYDLGVVDKDFYMAMEFIHGHDLMAIIKRGRKTGRYLSIPTGVHIITEVIRGLDYAHTLCDPGGRPLNVVHQDVSPHNILLSYEGDVKLVDFGIARVGEVVQEEAGRMAGGKFAYMAPEQALGEPVDHRSDIFAAGIILFELVTGQRLYAGKGRDEKVRMVRNASVPSPREINPEIPDRLNEIILRTLHRDPALRYQRARDLQEDLLSFLYDMAIHVTRAEVAEYLKTMFAEQYERARAGSVINRIVQDLGELSREAHSKAPDLTVEDGSSASGEASSSLGSVGWGAASDSSFSGGSMSGGTGSGRARLAQGERRQVDVLAVEVTGLTESAERVGEEELLRLNFSFLKTVAGLVRKYRGAIVRRDSDRLLIFWGLERTSSKDLELCVRCASDLRGLSERFAEVRGVRVHLSMGVHRGAVIVGSAPRRTMSKRRHRNFTPWGDTVKLARRLCDRAGLNEVLVSERVHDLLLEHGEFDPLAPVAVKWRSTEIVPFRLRRLRGRGERGASGRWIRRSDEFDRLQGVISQVAEGEASIFSIEGEAGSGKARFVREIREVTRDREVAFYVGRGAFFNREVPLLPYREILEVICGFEDEEELHVRRDKLARLVELKLDPIDLHLIGQLFGVDFPDSNLRYLAGDQLRMGTFDAIRKVFAGLSEERLLVLAIENLQHVDHYSVQLTSHLLRSLKNNRLLLIVTQPVGAELPFDSEVPVERLSVPPMGRDEARSFTAELLGITDLPDSLLDVVYGASGGNALFAKEIVAQLRRRDLVRIVGGQLEVEDDLSGAGIPASVGELIASRIDALSSDDRVVLEVAATVGKAFESALLREITGLGEEQLSEGLERLQAMKLVRRIREGEVVGDADFVFRNNLCWEVASNGVLASRRREFHCRAGEAIERLKSGELDSHFEELARHYRAGGLLRRAAGFAERAGRGYAKQFYDREAMRCFQEAVDHLGSAETEESEERAVASHLAELYLGLGEVQSRNLETEGAARSYLRALDLAGESEDELLQSRALIQLGRNHAELGRMTSAGAYLRRAQEQAERLQDKQLLTDADEQMARWALAQGDFDEAREALNRSLKLAREVDDTVRVARILGVRGSNNLKSGDFELSGRHQRRARDLALPTDDKILVGRLLNNLGVTYIHQQRLEDALEAYRQALDIRQGIEYRRGVVVNLHNIGDVYFRMGDDARAHQYFTESFDAARANDWEAGQTMNAVYLSYLACAQGDEAEGEEQLRAAIDAALCAGMKNSAAQGKVFLARVLARRGEADAARLVLDEAGELGDVVMAGLA
ncbi:MAG: protein kinase, partial [Myxococcota bacterium]|nr:protein kinase [Myxococcota bacterium]